MNGIAQLAGARIVSRRSAGSFVGEAWWATRSAAHRLEHQPLRGRHLAQPREVLARERAEVRVRQQPARERLLADPHHVADEVLEPQLGAARERTPGCAPGSSPVRTSSSLTLRCDACSSSGAHLVGLVQVRPVRRERAVLAMRDARPRKRQRHVAREADPPCRALDRPL